MVGKFFEMLLIGLVVSNALVAQERGEESTKHISEYVLEQNREIKSLSDNDIEQLSLGKGWGLAKAAELNGVPGPSHILDMSTEISLSETQEIRIKKIFDAMKEKAITLGLKIIEKERELNLAFARKEIESEELKLMTHELGELKGELTFVHLGAHLLSSKVLTEEQIQLYNNLRGYASGDVCTEVPEGHDAELWKKHNNCHE